MYTLYAHLPTDILSSLKSGNSPASNGGSVDTPLSTNDLSNSTVPDDRRLKDEEPEIFSQLQPGQLEPKGKKLQYTYKKLIYFIRCCCFEKTLFQFTEKLTRQLHDNTGEAASEKS